MEAAWVKSCMFRTRAMSLDSRINLRKLEMLKLVVELGSVTAAAKHLFVAQSVVSSHLRLLEERVGARLFYREGRYLRLTEAGGSVMEWADDVLTRAQELRRHLDGLSEGTRGTIILSTSMSIGSYTMPSILTTYRIRRPLIDIHVSIFNTEHAIAQARAGSADFAVVVADDDADTELAGMDVVPIGGAELVLIAAPGGPPDGDEVAVEDLAGLPFVEAPENAVQRRLIDRRLRDIGIKKREIVMHLGHPEAMKRATEAGIGVSLVFRSAVERELSAGLLREITVTGHSFTVPVLLVSRKNKTFSLLHRELIDEIRSAFATQADSSPEDGL